MLWIGPRISSLERLSIASFLANGHPVHLYAYGPIEGVPAGTTLRDAREVLPESAVFTYSEGFGMGSPAAFANEFRYKLLLERGGAWSDTDMVCLKPLSFLTLAPYLIAIQRMPPEPTGAPHPVRMNVCLMKVPARSAVMADCYAECVAVDRASLRWGMTGPDLATRAFIKHGLQHYALVPDVLCPVDFWRVRDLVAGPLPIQPEWHAIHFWNEIWRASQLDKDARYAPDCAFETLKRRYGV